MDIQIIPQFDDTINEYTATVPETGAEVFGATSADCAARLADARRVAQAHAQKSPQDSRAARARAILDAGLVSPNGQPHIQRDFEVRICTICGAELDPSDEEAIHPPLAQRLGDLSRFDLV